VTVSIDLPAIDSRLRVLQQQQQSTAYSKQKQSLKDELCSFLYALQGHKTIVDATPQDVCRFLVFKDARGKTQPHRHGCTHLGKKGIFPCQCPVRLAYSTVDSYIGKLRSIFSEARRQGDWNRALCLGNPAADDLVKQYLKAVTAEQLQARITPKQAKPFFPDKLLLLSRHLDKKLNDPSAVPSDLFILARDQAFFKGLFYSGDRANDLGQVKTPEIARFPDDNGLLFHHIWGKTLRDGASNIFGMKRHKNPSLCPVRGIETYVAVAREIGIDLTSGYLFRPTNPRGHVVDAPFCSSTAEARLKTYLREARLDAGETLHSFRAGCALTLTLSGSQLSDVMSHVGWSSPRTASYYLQLANVLKAGAPAERLAAGLSDLRDAQQLYTDYNTLRDFVTAFASPFLSNPKRSSTS
jgi:integrase